MISITELAGHEAAFFGAPSRAALRFGTGVPGVGASRPAFLAVSERVADTAQAAAGAAVARQRGNGAAMAAAASRAGARTQLVAQQNAQLHLWALRGLDPWSDPA